MLIKHKNNLYFEVSNNVHDVLKTLKPLIGSKILYYKNGNCFNEGAVDLNEGSYFPSLSLYKNCVLSVNFGPDFKYPPLQTDDFEYKGVCVHCCLFQLTYNIVVIIIKCYWFFRCGKELMKLYAKKLWLI